RRAGRGRGDRAHSPRRGPDEGLPLLRRQFSLPRGRGRVCDGRPRGTRTHHPPARRLPGVAATRVQSGSDPHCPRLNPARDLIMSATRTLRKNLDADDATALILEGDAPEGLHLDGTLELKGE